MDCRDDQDHDADQDTPRWTRAELALLRQAGRQRWAVPDAIKIEALYQLGQLLARGTDREKLSAARTLAVLDQIDQTDERQELERTRVQIRIKTHQGPGTSAVDPRVAEVALRAATAYYLEQRGETLADYGFDEAPGPGAGGGSR